MNSITKIIVVTGAESTGKSTLAQELAKRLNAPWCPEIARDYIEKLDRKYTYSDVETIARQQVLQLNQLISENPEIVILDTWLIITKIWFEVVFKTMPDWLDHEIRKTHIDLFLVCDTDLPWIYDPVRENGGEMRHKLQKKYIAEIKKYAYPYCIVSGQGIQRFENAVRFLKNYRIMN